MNDATPLPCPPLRLPNRAVESHKGSFGHVMLVGGSRGMAGSISLSALAALRVGSGLVSVMVPDRCLETVAGFDPAFMTIPIPDTPDGQFAIGATKPIAAAIQRATAIAAGPGMRTGDGSAEIIQWLVTQSAVPRLFDADAINLIAEHGLASHWSGPIVLTPHPGEMQRLSGISSHDREAQQNAAKRLSDQWQCVIVLKGAKTLVTDGRSHWFNSTGNPGMAKGGSGDCLTGVISGLLAQGLSPFDAARLGVFVHGLAGDLAAKEFGQYGMTPLDLVHRLPQAITQVIDNTPTTDT